jgi:hypothetical protein
MSKQSSVKSFVKERVDIPKVTKDKNGAAILLCPFCNPTHPLRADQATACGTIVRVQAVQTVFRSNYSRKNMVCVKCGKGGGEMVVWQNNAFVHTHDCSPGVAAMNEPPKISKAAGIIYNLHPRIKTLIELVTGKTMKVDEVTPDGKRTGVILGHFFLPRK